MTQSAPSALLKVRATVGAPRPSQNLSNAMENEGWTRDKICHWCGMTYEAQIGDQRRRFCSGTCKQAHYRAYKKYVTQTAEKISIVRRK